MGRKQTAETRRKISEKTQAARAKAREGGIPSHRRCAKCRRWKRVRDFPWRKVKLVSGEVRMIPYPRCKQCERERVAEYREKIGVTEMRRRYKKHHVARKRKRHLERQRSKRILKEPFIEWFLERKEKYRRDFLHEIKHDDFTLTANGGNAGGTDRGAATVEKARFDRASFCSWLGITVQEYETIMRLASPSSQTSTIPLELVDRVLVKAGRSDLLLQMSTKS